MFSDLKSGEKPFKEGSSIDGIFYCDLCACHYFAMCSETGHKEKCLKINLKTWKLETK